VIDLKRIRESPEETKASLVHRHPDYALDVDKILALDQTRRDSLQKAEVLKADRNSASKEVARRKKAGEDAGELMESLKEVSATIKTLDQELHRVETDLKNLLLGLPNPPSKDVPVGDVSSNKVIRSWGEPKTHDFDPVAHWELAERLGIIDMARGAKISGSGFPVYVGLGARLVRALVNLMMDMHGDVHGYREVWPPALVNHDSALGTGQLPDKEGQMYTVEADELYLVPTAEVPVTNLHRDEIIAEADLPFGYAAYSPSFRREAGAHGKDTRGIQRVHQFDKVELVRFCQPERSADELTLMMGHVEAVLQKLELPYRVVTLATGDLGFAAALTQDYEIWAAGVESWLEASSASTFTDFQARRANIRYRPSGGGKPMFVHTLNASGLAVPRTIIAILENNQQADGSVVLPEALVSYVGTDRLTPNGR
jgi:seryl-tRNA synthetase